MSVTVRKRTRGFPFVPRAEFNRIRKKNLIALVEMFHEKFLPRHFESSAHGRYDYQQRGRGYIISKQRTWGNRLDLVKTGRMRRELLSFARFSGTSKKARVTMQGPPYLSMRRKDPKLPFKAKELLAVTEAEILKLTKILDEDMAFDLQHAKTQQTKML